MTVTHLEVVARSTPELLERICRVLRHRGATVEHLVFTAAYDPRGVADAAGADAAAVRYTAAVERVHLNVTARLRGDADLLVRQLNRLPDVDLVRRREAPAVDSTSSELKALAPPC